MNRKVSIMLVFLLAVSLMMPVLSYAATAVFVYYDEESGELVGEMFIAGDMYSADPDQVSLTIDLGDEEKTVALSTYGYELGGLLFDDNNEPFSRVTFSVYVGQTPVGLQITDNGETVDTTVSGDVYSPEFQYNDDDIVLDVRRMEAQQYFSSVTADTYMNAGSNIVTFVPDYAFENAILLYLPHNESEQAEINFDNISLSDFTLNAVGSSVTNDVYLTELYYSESNALVFKTNKFMTNDQEYALKLSGTSGSNEILMPSSGTYNATLKAGYFLSSELVLTYNVKYFKNFSISSASTGGGGGYVPPSNEQAVNEISLKNGKDGKVEVVIGNGKKKVLLPANAAEAVGKNKLVLEGEELTAEIPSEVLADLADLVSEDELNDAEISFAFDKVSEEDTTGLLDKAKGNNKAEVKAAGDVYDFDLSIKTKDGKEKKLEKFKKPITLKLKVKEDADEDLIGGYFIGDEGELEYAGGELVDGKLAFDVKHFSKYGVLEYNKTFADVKAGFWAADAIKVMAAKHVVKGVNDTDFRPQGDMTRAEFAALIVRALDLKATKAAQFSDVSSDAWYAEAVAAASEAGIINGRSATTFAPNATIKREEMIAMIVRAYELKNGKKLSVDTEASFTDRAVASEWAQSYIDAAAKEGLVEGRANNNVAPQDLMTRAGGAQIVYRLLMN